MLRRELFVAFLVLLTVPNVGGGQEGEFKKFIATCSTTQVADFTCEIVGDRWEVRCILAAGQDPHTYETKPGDTKMVADADLILRNGWHLEGHEWMMNLAKDANKPVVTCVDGVKSLTLGGGAEVKDPHAWLSPINASIYVRNIVKGVSQIDPEHRLEYEARGELYIAQLRTLHLWVQREFNKIPRSQRVITTRSIISVRSMDFKARRQGGGVLVTKLAQELPLSVDKKLSIPFAPTTLKRSSWKQQSTLS